jgi:ribose-phosphate pyrophosphokinase
MAELIKQKFLFSTRSYRQQAQDLLDQMLFEEGIIERRDFSDGEHYLRIVSDVSTRDAILLGGTISDKDTIELYDIACGLVDSGVHRLWIVIPYYGCSTMERAVKSGEVVTAKTRARLLSSIPLPGSGAQIVLLDLHVDSIAWYFEGNMRPTHLQGKSLLLDMIKSLSSDENFVLGSTDAGRAKQVEKLANSLNVTPAFIFKRRLDSGATEVTAVSAQVKDKHVIIYDDMIRTGGSLIGAAKAYHDAGAIRISVVATHGIFAGDAVNKLRECGLIDMIIVTDSHPNSYKVESDFIKVVKISALLTDFLHNQ